MAHKHTYEHTTHERNRDTFDTSDLTIYPAS